MTKKKSPVSGVDHTGVCVSFVVFNHLGQVAIHKRGSACRDERNRWDTGSGQCLFAEDPQDAVLREIREEYGLSQELRIVPAGTSNVVRDASGSDKRSHWICFVYAAVLSQGAGAPPLVPADEEKTHVISPTWIYPDNLAMLPLHSQTAKHLHMALGALLMSAIVTSEDVARSKAAARDEMSEILASLTSEPAVVPLIEKAIAKRAAAAAAAPAQPETSATPS